MQRLRKLLFTVSSGLALTGVAQAQAFPELGFEDQPTYLDRKEVVLTFDDGPDWVNTAKVLDILRDKAVPAAFFINGNNWSNLDSEVPMQDLVRRIVREGHELGNHTQHHEHLPQLSDADIESEIAKVETSVKRILNEPNRSLTLLRAPHGEPYQNREPDFDRVARIVARHAVHIGWNIDSADWTCAPFDGACVRDHVLSEIDAGKYGVILLHSVHSQTVAALPGLIDELRRRGFTFKRTEDAVRRKYGRDSAQLLNRGPTITLPEADRTYTLMARHSGKCLDVEAGSLQDGGNIQQWSCHAGLNQKFRLERHGSGYRLRSLASGKCVDVQGAGQGNGVNIHQWACHDGDNQRVNLTTGRDGFVLVRFAHSGSCLDVSGPSVSDGTNVHQWQCFAGAANQEWLLRPE